MRWAKYKNSNQGFSLIEVMVALGILVTVSLGVAQLFSTATRSNQAGRSRTSSSILAAEKMEQLRGLTWGFDNTALGLPLSDTTTDLSYDPPTNGGPGLNPSPSGTLQTNTTGYVDYLDQFGNWVGTGSTPPLAAIYIRRWSVEPLPTNPNNTLIFQVMVTTVVVEATEAKTVTGTRYRLRDDGWIVSVKTRKAS